MPNFSINSISLAKTTAPTDWSEIAKLGKQGSNKAVRLKANGNTFRAYVQGKFSLTKTKVKASLGDRNARNVLSDRAAAMSQRTKAALTQKYGGGKANQILSKALGGSADGPISRGDIAKISQAIEELEAVGAATVEQPKTLSTTPEAWRGFLTAARGDIADISLDDVEDCLRTIAKDCNQLPHNTFPELLSWTALQSFCKFAVEREWSQSPGDASHTKENFDKEVGRRFNSFNDRPVKTNWVSHIPGFVAKTSQVDEPQKSAEARDLGGSRPMAALGAAPIEQPTLLSTRPEEWKGFLDTAIKGRIVDIAEAGAAEESASYLKTIADAVNQLPRTASLEERARTALHSLHQAYVEKSWNLPGVDPALAKQMVEDEINRRMKTSKNTFTEIWIMQVPGFKEAYPDGLPKKGVMDGDANFPIEDRTQ